MTGDFSFNLVDEPWIPCIDLDSAVTEYSLRTVFSRAHQLRAIVGDTPPVTAALHRLLLAMIHRVFGPKNEDAWAELWQAGKWNMEMLDHYLGAWKHRFDLFNEQRPFYQSADLYMESSWVSARRLVHHLGSINTLFAHLSDELEIAFSPSEAARSVVAAQGFSLCGTSGAFFPQKNAGGKKVQAMFVDGISARGISFMIEGSTLFETLMLNLIRYPDSQVIRSYEDDAPVWERDAPARPGRGPLTGYLDYLTWQNRRILLRPELDSSRNAVVRTMRWEPADRLEESLRDSMQHNIKNKKEGFNQIRFSETKSLWRDSSALLSVHQADADSQVHFPPATLRWLKYLRSPLSEVEMGLQKQLVFQCLALGMSSKRGQANVYFYREEHIPLPLPYFYEPELVTGLHNALQVAEKLGRDIFTAARIIGMYWQIADAESKSWATLSKGAKTSIDDWITHTGMEQNYWTSLEIPFLSFIVHFPQDQQKNLSTWYEQLIRVAWSALEQIAEYVGNDARSYKAVVRGRSYLAYRLNETIPNKEAIV